MRGIARQAPPAPEGSSGGGQLKEASVRRLGAIGEPAASGTETATATPPNMCDTGGQQAVSKQASHAEDDRTGFIDDDDVPPLI